MSDKMLVKITLESTQDGSTGVHIYNGEWFRKERSIYIRYEEIPAGGTDADQIRTLVRYRTNELSIARRGAVEAEQLFMTGVTRRDGFYKSPYTSFRMETDTKRLAAAPKDGREGAELVPPFLIEWEYDLWVNEQLSGRFQNKLHVDQRV